MSRIWGEKKKSLLAVLRDYDARSPYLSLMGAEDLGDSIRAVVAFDTRTLVRRADGKIASAGPVIVGIRYLERFLTEAPSPTEIAVILQPRRPWHPNIASTGEVCCGHPRAGLTMDLLLHQLWAGINLNMKLVNTAQYEVLQPEAAAYVRANAARFPLNPRGLFEHPPAQN